MRLLITGAAGFIGSRFVDMVRRQHQVSTSTVTLLDNLNYSGTLQNLFEFEKLKYEMVRGDICDSSLVSKLVETADLIIHFAAETHVDRSIKQPANFVITNVLGTQVLLDAVRENPKVKFIHVSTDEVYGSIAEGAWDENQPLDPNSPYSASKAASDLIALSYARTYNLDICVTRSCNNYGSNQHPEKLIPLFITNLIEGKKLPLYGDGKNVREWIHVEDNCRAIWEVAMHGKKSEIYNIGSGVEKSNLEITKLILDEFGLGEEMIDFVPDRLNHDYRYSLDTTKIRSELSFSPQWDFEEGIRSTINWYRDNPMWWQPLKNL